MSKDDLTLGAGRDGVLGRADLFQRKDLGDRHLQQATHRMGPCLVKVKGQPRRRPAKRRTTRAREPNAA